MRAIAPDLSSVLHVCPRGHGMFVPPLAWHVLPTRPGRVSRRKLRLELASGTLYDRCNRSRKQTPVGNTAR